MSDEHTEVSEATRQEEAEEAHAEHVPGEPTGPEDEDALDEHEVDPEVRAQYREMTEIGANDPGEGRIP